ncbi:MAG: four helix bundle protein [Acidobacteria bacterium]|nr:four helix bundle protein [Acidobacteriota bacterium]
MRDVEEVEEVKEVKEVKEKVPRRGPVKHYEDLLVYQQSYRLALEVSRLTRTFPKQEQFELGRQLRDCSRSVPANIVEGWAKRNSAAEFKRHLVIAIGECAERKHWLSLAADEEIADRKKSESLKTEYSKLGMMLHKLWKEWRKLG